MSDNLMDMIDIRRLAKAIVEEMDTEKSADLAYKWEGGSVRFIPGDSDTQEHEIPIDTMMQKIIAVRDNLRVLEQQINSSKTLSSAEKLKFQNYISKSYGSLTSFNFVFRNNEDKFSSK